MVVEKDCVILSLSRSELPFYSKWETKNDKIRQNDLLGHISIKVRKDRGDIAQI